MRRRKPGAARAGVRPHSGYGLSAALALTLIAIGFATTGGAGAATSAATSTANATGAVVGDTTQESGSDMIPGGTAEAYAYTAATAGNIQTAHVYIRSGSTATKVAVGLYSDSSGQPGTLLTTCAISSPAADAWQTCSANATVTAGTRYWIALLPTGGSLYYATKSTESSQTDSDRQLTAEPSAWSTGTAFTDGPASAFFDGSGGQSSPPPDTTPPSAPTGVTRTSATGTSIAISWNASTDNLAVAGYGVYLAGAAAGGTGSLVASSTATTLTLTGLTCGTSYNVSVDAFDAAGNRSSKTTITTATSACATTAPPPNPNRKDRTPPSAPGGLHVQASTANSVTVAWLASTDNVGVAGYNAYENGGKIGTTTALTYTLTGLACGTSYTFGVEAFDAAGNTSTRTTIVAATQACPVAPPPPDTQPPTAPTNVHVTAATGSTITIAWTASTDNVGVTAYGVYNGTSTVSSTASLSYTVPGLTCGSTYTLAVDAADAAGNRSAKTSVTASTAACPPTDTQPPTAPTNLLVTGATQSSVTISWSAATDNVGVTSYRIYNGTATVGDTSSLSFTVTGLACGTTYTLAVDAADAAGNRSTKTSISNATTSACATSGGLFLSPSGSDANACTQLAPCLSFQRAYNLALAGQVVQLASGTYSSQVLAYNAVKTALTSRVVFRPAPGASVTIDGLDINGGQHIEFDNINFTHDLGINYADVNQPNGPVANDVYINGGRLQTFHIISANNVTINGVDIGHYFLCDNGGAQSWVATHQDFPSSHNILIQNSTFQGIRRCHDAASGSGIHAECLFIQRVDGLTIRNNKMLGCPIFAIAGYDATSDANNATDSNSARHVLIENNFLSCGNDVDPCGGGQSIELEPKSYERYSDWTIRYNSSPNSFVFATDTGTGSYTNMQAYANVASGVNCPAGWTNSYNVVQGTPCGSGSVNAPSGFVDPSWGGDYHLTAGAKAIDLVPSSVGGPSQDIDGQPRPNGAAFDAGADEYAGSAPPPPPPPPAPLQPVGDPLGRTWTPVLDDEFNGTSIDTSKWVALNGWGNNNVTSNAKNCSESGGNLILALPGDGTGCDLYSSKTYGAGVNAHDLLVGDYLEARIYFPGSNAPNPSSTSDNWPAFWTYDGSGNWNAGENDIAESLGNVNFYYHGPNGYSRQILPAGNWANSWHVYGLYRDATQVQVFRDGVSIGTVPTTDNGGPQAIMFTSGDSNSCCGSPTVHGSAANVLVDWVREWK